MKVSEFKRNMKEWWARKRLQSESPALCRDLEEMISKSRSTGCSYQEYRFLYRWLMRHRPAKILELGSGMTSLVIAHVVKQMEFEGGARSEFVSMEQSKEFYDDFLKNFPERMKEFGEFKLSELAKRECENGDVEFYYTDTPEKDWDFVFIDGPYMEPGKGHFNADYWRVLQRSEKKVCALLDGRKSTREVYQKRLKRGCVRKTGADGFTYLRASRNDIVDHQG